MTTEERLEKLERELARANRRNRHLLIGSAICLGMIFALAFFAQPSRFGTAQAEGPTTAPVQGEVRAKSFVLEDENGKDRAVLTMLKDGPVLVLIDENGKRRAGLAASKEVSGLGLYDENGNRRAMLSADKDRSGLDLIDANGKTIWQAP